MRFNEIKNLHENQQVIDKLEDKKFDLERALEDAREITKDIKRADMHMDIVIKMGNLAEQHGLQIDDYQERKVFQAKNQLESEIFELEEVFKEAIKNIDNKIEQLGYEE
ncbi:hypothetical protein N9C44_01710 [bacterium]|nr:hypothetical protein [bacterium]|tara:strand:- start:2073 stop:2399 length:327 start_codon:yes stop_codon:yes gene_type:complete